ncbi:YihY/virulence factor BrkB family protein [Roseomonas nepalensis]|uniref:YihY/virulence factor BrkB family protein n=1 Tax=Muricoccus nepalensis TaxID=1854500 RepID=A0A502F4V9_9PROT|nr:YihY/virulence factor BrkB family protein [Roseomonas nepalensis]TPG44897.1 YihY/virulence factor BrkB family protein [Roseomonas nepalensis]
MNDGTKRLGLLIAATAATIGLMATGFSRRQQTVAVQGSGEHGSRASNPSGQDHFQSVGNRGQSATKPSDIPARGWWDILRRTASQASKDRLLTEAAGVTFYAILALFPALSAMVSLYGLFADPGTINDHLASLSGFVPGGGMDIISEQVRRVASQGDGTLGFGAAAGLLLSLWSANGATKAVFDALNVVYEEDEKRGFVRRTLTTLAFTIGAILFALFAMAAVVVLPILLDYVGLGSTFETLLRVLRWPLLLAAVGVLLACLFRYGPSRDTARWRWVSWGGAFAAVAWLLGSAGFSFYVANFGSYNETYGALGAVIGFMTWIWISTAIVLVGAELDAEMERQTERDTTEGPEEPLGARGAKMADTVA